MCCFIKAMSNSNGCPQNVAMHAPSQRWLLLAKPGGATQRRGKGSNKNRNTALI